MKISKITLFISFLYLLESFNSFACSPCQALSNVTQTLNGTNLELTFTSNAGWNCCYTVNIELICANANFTGTPNYFSQEICINGGGGASTPTTIQVPYPSTVIDLSNYCPGNYKWRAVEQGCGIYTPEYQFTLGGSSPIQVLLNASQDTICKNQNTLLSSSVSNGCNSNNFTYSWSPATGLNNASLANPVATPTTTTTYSLTVSEAGSCTLPQTSSVTIVVNPLPTATLTGTTSICQNDASPTITFSGSGGTAPYTINYSLNGVAQPPLQANPDFSINPPTSIPGTYIYSLVNVQDASNTQCFQNQTGNAVITVNQLPVISAGADQVLCEPNDQTPSTVTLTGSGGVSYVWDNGISDGIAFIPPPEQTTTYTVIGTDANGCTGTDQVAITSLTLPVANGTPSDTLGNVPFTVNLTNLSAHATNYVWDFGNGSTQNTSSVESVSTMYLEAGIYTITLVASNGICSEEWNTEIVVLPPMTVEVPTIFTPNDDKLNDFYFVNVKNSETFEATISNRWGEIMCEFKSADQMWDGKLDGKPVSDGVYFIQYKAVDYGGITVENHTFFHLNR